jgi:hypothetical protein
MKTTVFFLAGSPLRSRRTLREMSALLAQRPQPQKRKGDTATKKMSGPAGGRLFYGECFPLPLHFFAVLFNDYILDGYFTLRQGHPVEYILAFGV